MEKIASKQKEIARNQIAYITHIKAYLDNLTKILTTLLGKIILRNLIMEQPAQVSLTTEI